MQKRDSYFDMIRGLAICGVVFIHAFAYTAHDGTHAVDFFTIFLRNALNCSVPLFIAVSGYFLSSKKIDCRKDYFSFIKRQVLKIYVPFLVWAFIFFVAEFGLEKTFCFDGVWRILSFQSSGQYYFVFLVVQFYIFLPILLKWFTASGVFVSLLFSLVFCTGLNLVKFLFYLDMPPICYAGNFLVWLVFFILGGYFGRGGKLLFSNRTLLCVLILSLILSCAESYAVLGVSHSSVQSVSAVMPLPFIYSFCVISILFGGRFIPPGFSAFVKIGRVAFGVFLIHEFILRCIEKIVGHFGFDYVGILNELIQVGLSGLVVFLCVFLLGSLVRLLPIRSHKWLGLI